VNLYLRSPVRLHGVVLEHRDNFLPLFEDLIARQFRYNDGSIIHLISWERVPSIFNRRVTVAMVQSASNYLHEVPQGRRKISSSSWEETTFNLLVISFHNLYEGRLQSSWTHLINPSWSVVDVQ